MKKKHIQWFSILVIIVIITFGVFMLIAVPEENTLEEIQRVEGIN